MSSLQEILADELEEVQWHGHYFSCICAFPHDGHIESHPSMLVYPDGFVCKGCGKRGRLKYLQSQLSKRRGALIKAPSSYPVLPRWRSWSERFGGISGIADFGHRALKAYPEHYSFFKKRGIDSQIDKGMFGYIDGWALFPVFDAYNSIVDIIARRIKKDEASRYVIIGNKGGDPYLYVPNWTRIKTETNILYVVFGIIDAWSLELLSLPVVTGTTGKAIAPSTIKELGERNIFIIPDRYEEKEAYDLAYKLGWKAKVLRLKYPDECKDPDDIRMKVGPESLMLHIEAANGCI